MWDCGECRVSFHKESIEQHIYTNHIQPTLGPQRVYNCGQCVFGAESFEQIAFHCLTRSHPTQLIRKGVDYGKYGLELFRYLNRIVEDSSQTERLLTPINERSVRPSSNKNDIEEEVTASSSLIKRHRQLSKFKTAQPIVRSQKHKWSKDSRTEEEGSVPDEFVQGLEEEEVELTEEEPSFQSIGTVNNESTPLVDPTIISNEDDIDWSTTIIGGENGGIRDIRDIFESINIRAFSQEELALKSPKKASNDLLVNNKNNTENQAHKYLLEELNGPEDGGDDGNKTMASLPFIASFKQKPVGRPRKDNLTRDERRKLRIIECRYCPKTSHSINHMQGHERIHTGEKPFTCPTCGKRFRRRDSLRKHTVYHANERAFTCEDCGKRFNSMEILMVHIRTHNGLKPIRCYLGCGASFTCHSNMRCHMKKCMMGLTLDASRIDSNQQNRTSDVSKLELNQQNRTSDASKFDSNQQNRTSDASKLESNRQDQTSDVSKLDSNQQNRTLNVSKLDTNEQNQTSDASKLESNQQA